MPSISNIADIVTLTLPTIRRSAWDSVGLAQLYPDYESVRQFVQAARRVEENVAATNLTRILYPNDEPEQGKQLRLEQQYFYDLPKQPD